MGSLSFRSAGTAVQGTPLHEDLLRSLSRPLGAAHPGAFQGRVYRGQLLPWVEYAEAAGTSWKEALGVAGVRGHPDDPSVEVTTGQLGSFVEALAARGPGAGIAVRAAAHGAVSAQPPRLQRALASSPTLLSALVTARELISLTGPAIRIEFCLTPSHLYLGHLSAARGDAPGASVLEIYRSIALLALVRRYAGADWRPAFIGVTSDPPADRELSGWLQEGRLIPSLACCVIPVPLEILRRGAVDLAEGQSPSRPEPAALLELALPSALLIGSPGIAAAAEMVGMSVRTLQRRLREGGDSYRQLLGRVRLREGWRLLEETDTPVREVALRLGYEEPTNFTRAFRRRFGLTPSQVRRVASAPCTVH